jgi:hypothetical protein
MKKISVLALCLLNLLIIQSCSTRPKLGLVYIYLVTPAFSFEEVTVHVGSLAVHTSRGELIVLSTGTQTITVRPDQGWPFPLNSKNLEAGDYSGISLRMDSGTVIMSGVSYTLQVPDVSVAVAGGFSVVGGKNNYIDLVFDIDKSILPDGLGGYILRPVIQAVKEGS